MVILPRQSLFLLICGLALVCVIIGLLVPTPVQADVGVQPVLPGGSSIQPGEETPIQMAGEVVVMNVRSATEADNALVKLNPRWYGYDLHPIWFPAIAEVEADFTMKNPTSEAVSMPVWFPLASALENASWRGDRPSEIVPRIEHFQVSVDSNPVDFAVNELPNPKGEDSPPLPWASFPVTFPGEQETVIHISYMLPLQPSVKGVEMILYYIFQTGAGWAGSIGQAELILNLPYPASAATMSGMRKLYLPPMFVQRVLVDLPSGAVLEGNQARWRWKDFEPGPEDDFAIWLLRPGKWQELETARAAVQVDPQDGQAWLDLASIYLSLTIDPYRNVPLLFSPFYLPPGIEAYQKAADLLPEHPAPHICLGLLTLAPYLESKNAPLEVIQSVQEELRIAKELEAKNPSLAKEAGISSLALENALRDYFYNDATATVDAATRAVENATAIADEAVRNVTKTAEATLNYATATALAIARATYMSWWATDMACWATAGAGCTATASPTVTLTPKPAPTSTPVPSATPPPITAETTSKGQSTAIIVAAGAISLVIVGYLALKRSRKRVGK